MVRFFRSLSDSFITVFEAIFILGVLVPALLLGVILVWAILISLIAFMVGA